jgi:hypothetical protein
MLLVPEGVKVVIDRGGKLLSYHDLATAGAIGTLPEPLLRFLKSRNNPNERVFVVAWPEARRLYDELRAHPASKLRVDARDIETLTPIDRPANFEIRWIYDPAQRALVRQLINADRHLGMGWFQDDRYVWPLDRNLPSSALKWVAAHLIRGREIAEFITDLLPMSKQAKWPISTNLRLLEGFTVRLDILRWLDHGMEVQMIGSVPGILHGLQFIDGDDRNMISGDKIVTNIRPALSDKLLKIAQADRSVQITGTEFAAFIQDDLRPRAAQLGVDMRTIDRKYPISEPGKLAIIWKIRHEVDQGVGQYRVVPYIGDYPLPQMVRAAENGERFYPTDLGWLSLTPAFKARLAAWKSEGITDFRVSPQEILGQRSPRLGSLKIQPPDIHLPDGSLSLAHIASFMDALRHHGLPGGFSGLHGEARDVLAGVCKRLLNDYDKAQILWIVSQKKRPGVVMSLQKGEIPYESAERAANLDTQPNSPANDVGAGRVRPAAGRVILTSPGVRVELAKDWTLIILQDLDILSLSDSHTYFYSQLDREWTLATFNRADWYADLRRARLVMQALQLAPENLDVFRTKYVRAYPEQNETLFSRLISPFRKTEPKPLITQTVPIAPLSPPMLPESLPTQQIEAAPSPLRETPTTPTQAQVQQPPQQPPRHPIVPVRPPTPQPKPVRSERPPVRESFVAQARRYASRTEAHANLVPYPQLWPTYETMRPEQQKWYFYWRSELRRANFLPTDLGYLFLYVYEALNLIGFTSAQAAFDHLTAFWKYYRREHPKLDNYLVDWLADFIVVYRLPPLSPLTWYDQARREGAVCGDFDLHIEAWLQNGADLATLPDEFIFRLAGYSPTKNKFYQEHNQGGQLDIAYRKAVRVIDQFVRQYSDNKSLVEVYRPAEARVVVRQPFAGAPHELGHQTIGIAKASQWSVAAVLSRKLTSILKYTENILRKQANFKSKLQGIDLPQEWITTLESAFTVLVSVPRREIKIDMSSVDALKRDSDELRRRLIIQEEGSTEERLPLEMTPPPRSATPLPASPSVANIGAEQIQPANPSLPDLDAVLDIMGNMHGTAANILDALRDNGWQADESALRSGIKQGHFLNVELNRINERAVNTLGDALIFEEDGRFVVAEDYRDEIEYALDHHRQPDQRTVSSPVTPVPAATENGLSGELGEVLNDEWAKFARKMQPHHWETLAVLVAGIDVPNRLEAVARGAFLTTSRLIDDINSFALDCLGDIVIRTDADEPYIEADDVEDLQALVTWATEHALVEK